MPPPAFSKDLGEVLSFGGTAEFAMQDRQDRSRQAGLSYVWTDSEVPAGLLSGNRVSKYNDFEWTLNLDSS
jgi:hypothetical protein